MTATRKTIRTGMCSERRTATHTVQHTSMLMLSRALCSHAYVLSAVLMSNLGPQPGFQTCQLKTGTCPSAAECPPHPSRSAPRPAPAQPTSQTHSQPAQSWSPPMTEKVTPLTTQMAICLWTSQRGVAVGSQPGCWQCPSMGQGAHAAAKGARDLRAHTRAAQEPRMTALQRELSGSSRLGHLPLSCRAHPDGLSQEPSVNALR